MHNVQQQLNNMMSVMSADQTIGRKNGAVIIYIKVTEAVDAEQLIAKSNSCVEYQLIHIKNAILLLMCTVL